LAGPGASSGSVSAVEAYAKLSDPELNAQLLDIRAPEDVRAEGSPNLKSVKKSVLKVSYAADDGAFVDKVLAKCKAAEDTTLYVLDRFDGSSATVAKLLANSGFKSAYAIKGGAEGSNGWNEKDLPWATPSKALKLDLGNLKNLVGNVEGVDVDSASLVPTTLGVAAAAGVGLVILSEAETTLQLLGTVALVQLFVKKFLYSVDRKKTIEDLKSFLNTKIAPKELIDDVKEVGRVLLPKGSEVKAATQTGEEVLKEKLNVESVTPEALAEKAKDKIGEVVDKAEEKIEVEAEKRGVELPDLKAAIQTGEEALKEKLEVESVTPEALAEKAKASVQTGEEVLKEKLDVESVTPEALAEKAEDKIGGVVDKAEEKIEVEAEKRGVELPDLEGVKSNLQSNVEPSEKEVEESSNGSATPALGATPAAAPLPVLQEPPNLTPKAEQEPIVETPAEEPSTNTETKPFFESDADVKPASPFEPVASAISSANDSEAAAADQEPVVETLVAEPSKNTETKPLLESDADVKLAGPSKPVASAVSSADDSESAAAAFEGDEPPAYEEPGASERITAKELEVSASSRAGDTSS
jgi:rhodanese-related sulfurtransferase